MCQIFSIWLGFSGQSLLMTGHKGNSELVTKPFKMEETISALGLDNTKTGYNLSMKQNALTKCLRAHTFL